ncbi:MAG: hypothetical protein ACI31F_00340, partial [Muribaculaceae bacterium]
LHLDVIPICLASPLRKVPSAASSSSLHLDVIPICLASPLRKVPSAASSSSLHLDVIPATLRRFISRSISTENSL